MSAEVLLPPDDPEIEKALVALSAEGREAAAALASRTILEGGPIWKAKPMQRRAWIVAASEAARVTSPIPVSSVSNVEKSKPTTKNTKIQGQEVSFPRIEPWPEPVDGATLLDEIIVTLRRFLSLPEGAPEAIALWIVFAYAHDCFSISPLLAFTSAEKRSGKTTALLVLGAIVPRPLSVANITTAAVFRSVDQYHPTQLVDEADTFLSEKDELRGVLNSGHSRRSAFLIRTVGDHHEVRMFSTWGPKAVALIGTLPDTLADRAVIIPMKRRARGERLERLRNDRLDELGHVSRKTARWVADAASTLSHADPEVPEALDDRAADNWRPLLAIADAAGGDWPTRARRAALILSAGRDEDVESIRTQLLGDVRQIFADLGTGRLASKELAGALRGLEDRPWADWSHGRGLSPNQLARQLAPFDIRPRTMRLPDGARLKGYGIADFGDAFSRYLPPPPLSDRDGVTTRAGTDETPQMEIVTGGDASRSKNDDSGAPVSLCPGVTAQTGERGGAE